MSNVSGSGLDALVVVSADPSNTLARVFTFSQAQAGGGSAHHTYSPRTPITLNGVYARGYADRRDEPTGRLARPAPAHHTDRPAGCRRTP